MVNKNKRLTGMIKRTFQCINRSIFLTIYKSLIRSTVDYKETVWYPFSKKNIQMIKNIQRRATRIVPDLKGLKKIVGSNNFSAQFIKIISHYKKIGYNINVLQQTACLVVNQITVGNFAFLFNCTTVGRTSDSMMVPT